MPKNRIIPQMHDVRPVDETGGLDWQKIYGIGMKESDEAVLKKKSTLEKNKCRRSTRAYYLGIPVESEEAPIFHDQEFNLINAADEKRVKRDGHRLNVQERSLEIENESFPNECRVKKSWKESDKHLKFLDQRKKEIEAAEILRLQKEKELIESVILEKRRQEEARIAEISAEKKRKEMMEAAALERREQAEIRQAAILAERKKREEQELEWLKIEQQNGPSSLVGSQKAEERADADLLKEEIRKKKISSASSYLRPATKKKRLMSGRSRLFLNDALVFSENGFQWKRFAPAFAVIALVLTLTIGSISFASKGLGMQGKVLGVSQDGFANLTGAIEDLKAQDFDGSAEQFSKAHDNFSQASGDLEDLGGDLLDAARFFPFTSKISSGKNAVEAGKHFSVAGQSLNEVLKTLAKLKQGGGQNLQENVSLLEIFETTEKNVIDAKKELDEAQKNIDLISIDDLPEDKQEKFLILKEKLPELRSMMQTFLDSSHIFVELLGGNGPRKYLFLFQNNSEIRATGGFIGSYGLLDIANGHVKKFFIDGIFNPDGQLKDKIVPPLPIQKISASWSLHDSNWFPDFPTSAKKAISFYEKTGGPTADGVISLTPTMMQKLLKITGPIEMPEYGVTLDSDNFIQLTQYKVEVDYDKQDNRPKKILSDLAPILLEKLLNSKSLESILGSQRALMEGLNEKHILFYSQNQEIEDIISAQGWSGKILPTDKDYISVINTNINGYKTDAAVEESIVHNADIQADGSIIDSVQITRKHTGGNSKYDWLNKVNADYMRVYVPKGSKLLEVSGQTREIDYPPLDYDALGFKRDEDVKREEDGTKIDSDSGTRIYEENDKTVFANWVYVSPQESVTVSYRYVLPFRLFQLNVGKSQKVDSYSLVAQKQSGSVGSSFSSSIDYPEAYSVKWKFPQSLNENGNELKKDTNLVTDYFEGVVFENIKENKHD